MVSLRMLITRTLFQFNHRRRDFPSALNQLWRAVCGAYRAKGARSMRKPVEMQRSVCPRASQVNGNRINTEAKAHLACVATVVWRQRESDPHRFSSLALATWGSRSVFRGTTATRLADVAMNVGPGAESGSSVLTTSGFYPAGHRTVRLPRSVPGKTDSSE